MTDWQCSLAAYFHSVGEGVCHRYLPSEEALAFLDKSHHFTPFAFADKNLWGKEKEREREREREYNHNSSGLGLIYASAAYRWFHTFCRPLFPTLRLQGLPISGETHPVPEEIASTWSVLRSSWATAWANRGTVYSCELKTAFVLLLCHGWSAECTACNIQCKNLKRTWRHLIF